MLYNTWAKVRVSACVRVAAYHGNKPTAYGLVKQKQAAAGAKIAGICPNFGELLRWSDLSEQDHPK